MFNLARLFAYTRRIESDLESERAAHAETRRKSEEERQRFIDYMARAAGKSAVFDREPPPKKSNVPPLAFGPTMSAQRQEAKRREAEILQRAAAVQASNGHRVDAPEIPAE